MNISSSQTLRPLSIQDLADLYGKSAKVIRRWLSPIQDDLGPRNGHYYTPRQVQRIYDHLGPPPLNQ
jgi:hypothetical protein